MKNIFNIFVIIFVSFCSCFGFPGDQIKQLPGLTFNVTFRQYSGYLDVGRGRHYHYWFVESQSKPESDPVILWLNGGPGCSSLGGFWTENGPFRVESDGKSVVADPHSWNTLANVLYLESPVGVGYSYSENKTIHNSDDSTAEDNYLALQKFYEKFPHFTYNSFYITGESYAGVYIPMLAINIFKNKANINLKGVAIGNGALDHKILSTSRVKFAYTHGLIDSKEYNNMIGNCCKCDAKVGQVCDFENQQSHNCSTASARIRGNIVRNGINAYNIYSDCNPLSLYLSDSPYVKDLQTYFGIDSTEIQTFNQTFSSNAECLSDGYRTYISSPEVRKALHIPDQVPKWAQCSNVHYQVQYRSMKTQIKELVEKHKIPKLIVFNGDIDIVCDFLGDQQFVDELGYKLTANYTKWTVEGRTAGFFKRYEGIDFMTVRFSGHMVPRDQPKAALAIIKELIGISKVA